MVITVVHTATHTGTRIILPTVTDTIPRIKVTDTTLAAIALRGTTVGPGFISGGVVAAFISVSKLTARTSVA